VITQTFPDPSPSWDVPFPAIASQAVSPTVPLMDISFPSYCELFARMSPILVVREHPATETSATRRAEPCDCP